MVEYQVEVGRGGKFTDRNRQVKYFKTKSEALRYARSKREGNAVAVDRLSNGSQRTLVMVGNKGKGRFDENFGSLGKERKINQPTSLFGGPSIFGFNGSKKKSKYSSSGYW